MLLFVSVCWVWFSEWSKCHSILPHIWGVSSTQEGLLTARSKRDASAIFRPALPGTWYRGCSAIPSGSRWMLGISMLVTRAAFECEMSTACCPRHLTMWCHRRSVDVCGLRACLPSKHCSVQNPPELHFVLNGRLSQLRCRCRCVNMFAMNIWLYNIIYEHPLKPPMFIDVWFIMSPVMRCQNPVKRWEISKAIPFVFYLFLNSDRKNEAKNSRRRIPERYPMIPKTPKVEKAKGNHKCWMVSRVNRGFDSHSYIMYRTIELHITIYHTTIIGFWQQREQEATGT